MFSATSFLDPRCESSGPKQPGNGRVPSQRLDIGQSRSTMRPVVRYRDKANRWDLPFRSGRCRIRRAGSKANEAQVQQHRRQKAEARGLLDLWSVTIGDMLRILFIFVSPLAAASRVHLRRAKVRAGEFALPMLEYDPSRAIQSSRFRDVRKLSTTKSATSLPSR
jgi:hypothetical protein